MTVVKSVQLRKNLKEILQSSYSEEVVIDYYGQQFRITPVQTKIKGKTQAQRIIDYFKNQDLRKLTSPIFNEADPAQEKANIRKAHAQKYVL